MIGQKAPFFQTDALVAKEIKLVSLSDFANKYVVLFFYPLDFTFVCPTELHAFEAIRSTLEGHNAVLIGCSVDSAHSHLAWKNTPKNQGGIEGINYILLSDLSGKIAKDYNVLSDHNIAYRGVFIMDKEHIIRSYTVNDLPIGRNCDEVIRTLQALQHVEKYGEVCPANWKSGSEAIKPDTESVKNYLNDKK